MIVFLTNNFAHLAGAVGSEVFELRDTFTFTITVIFAIVYASCQRHSIDIETLIPVEILADVLQEIFNTIKIHSEPTEHSQMEFAQPLQKVKGKNYLGTFYQNSKLQ